jgi:anaerobic magnesium-protoporphyrin IX monomethyl ester cyclase
MKRNNSIRPRLALVQPPTLAGAGSGLYALAALATYVEDVCEVKIIDPTSEPIERTLKAFDPDVVGITSYTVTYAEAIETMKTVKAAAPKALRIVGGVHISCLPGSLHEVFDFGVIGDGEEVLRTILLAESRTEIESLPGTCYRRGVRLIRNQPAVGEIAFPVPLLHKFAPGSGGSGTAVFITSRGCPFRCAFCYSPAMRGGAAYYPVGRVADEFEYALKTLKANYLMLLDDTVCLDIARLDALADELEGRKLPEFSMAVNVRSSAMTEELCRALHRLHVVSWNCGFESGSNRVLKEIKGPSASVDKHRQLVEMAREHGMTLNGSFMLGIPGETLDDMNKTLGFMEFLYGEKVARRYRGGFWTFCATPFPGTSWWELAVGRGKVSSGMDWSRLDIKRFDDPLMLDQTISPDEWRRVCEEASSIVEKSNSVF